MPWHHLRGNPEPVVAIRHDGHQMHAPTADPRLIQDHRQDETVSHDVADRIDILLQVVSAPPPVLDAAVQRQIQGVRAGDPRTPR